jgi:hypothetical protein
MIEKGLSRHGGTPQAGREAGGWVRFEAAVDAAVKSGQEHRHENSPMQPCHNDMAMLAVLKYSNG